MKNLAASIAIAFALPVAFFSSPAFAADFKFVPTVDAEYDFNDFNSDKKQFKDDHDFRRSRLGFKAQYKSWFTVRGEYDFEPHAWTDAYVMLQPSKAHSITIGQAKVPVGLEQNSSSKWTTFMEAAMLDDMTIGRRLSGQYKYDGGSWTAAAAMFGKNLTGDNPGQGSGARFTWTPLKHDNQIVHLGGSWATENPDSNTYRIQARPEAKLTKNRLVNTGVISNVHSVDRTGVEFGWVNGPWSVQSEYLATSVNRTTLADLSFDGYYVYASWFPTGHSRGYKAGVFDAPNLDSDKQAWELALRLSELNLNDGVIKGGEEKNITAGITWYPNKRWRLMANYVDVTSKKSGISDNPNILEFRAQFVY